MENIRLSPTTTGECQSNCLGESIAAQSAKQSRLALIPEVMHSHWESNYGCSGEQVSEYKTIH
ncbi:hypothetical protein VB713_15325 [Anabaena cylindrica UHCC 0172]|uniref:hypothetical protein n=1 Tax=Anabaena cylindrica TaxID=1165 RepID=UPI002B1EAC12|nr:hypothetical protein [Anabaena cylindrica]MEA5552312.1 hypothetical protein [Anabaena cylindrica UHCC 0172]